MKRCPQCGREYDNSMSFCLDDGVELLYGPALMDEPATAVFGVPPAGGLSAESATRPQIPATPAEPQGSFMPSPAGQSSSTNMSAKPLAILAGAVLILVGGFFAYRYYSSVSSTHIESIAVMPFVNESGNPDFEYLSDGMT